MAKTQKSKARMVKPCKCHTKGQPYKNGLLYTGELRRTRNYDFKEKKWKLSGWFHTWYDPDLDKIMAKIFHI